MTARIVAGVTGGLAGGVLFGVMMHATDMIAMIGGLVGSEGVPTGWIVHLVISAVIGVGFAVTVGALRPGYGGAAVYGLIYGTVWWVLGPLLLMPLLMGMGPFPAIGRDQVLSLIGHLAYGLVLAVVYVAVRDRSRQASRAAPAHRGRDTEVRV